MRDQIIEVMASAIAATEAGKENAMESEFKSGNLWFRSKFVAQAALQALLDGGYTIEKVQDSSRDQSPSTTRAPLASDLTGPQSGGDER